MTIKPFYILLVLLGISYNSNAQIKPYQAVWQTRNTAAIGVDVTKKWSFSAQYQVRTLDVLQFSGSYISVGASYKYNKNWSVETQYRFKTSYLENKNRIRIGATYSHKLNKLQLSNRLLLQYSFAYLGTDYAYNNMPSVSLRNRLQAKYPLTTKIDAIVSIEPFLYFSNKGDKVSQVRSILGINYDIGKKQSISLFYLTQYQWKPQQDVLTNAIGITYQKNIDFVKSTKKKKAKKDKINKVDKTAPILPTP